MLLLAGGSWRELCCPKSIRAGMLPMFGASNTVAGWAVGTRIATARSLSGRAAVPKFEMAKTHPHVLRHSCGWGPWDLGTTGVAACLAVWLFCASAQLPRPGSHLFSPQVE